MLFLVKQSENNKKHEDIRFVNSPDKAKKIASKVTIGSWFILSEYITMYNLKKSSIILDKPMHVGFTILETSKYEICFNYDRLKNGSGDNMQHLYTYTDSLKLLLKITNPYKF